MHALTRKLARDLRRMRGQLLAVAAIVACGTAALVTQRNMYHSLLASRDAYYARYRFADAFASLTRAPLPVAERLAAIPGVTAVEPRLATEVTVDVPGLVEPATARLLSVPVRRPQMLALLHLRRGRPLDPAGRDEVLVGEAFADANGLAPGDTLTIVLAGRWRRLRIAGIALSPEYVYAVAPGQLFPDDRRYGVLWMREDELAAALDRRGAFNDVALDLARGASPPRVLEAVDRVLAPYGGQGAYGREEQLSNVFVTSEIEQNRASALFLPVVFLAIAAFLTHLVLSRLVTLQRDQIAVLKAFGYTDGQVARHFVTLALVPVVAGAIAGVGLGLWAGHALAEYYTHFFHFPELAYESPPSVALSAMLLSAASASAGAFGAARRAARLPPAEAMRPAPPARFGRGLLERLRLHRALSPAARMVARNLLRRPVQTGLSVFGVAWAVAILVTGFFVFDAVDYVADLQFHLVQREDVSVTFEHSVSTSARHALARLPGILRVEPFRAVPARLVAGPRSRRVAILGVDPAAQLRRVVDRHGNLVELAPGGIVLTTALAELLDVRVGQTVTVEVLEEQRPVREVVVVQLADELVGTAAYMRRDELDRLAGGAASLSGAWLDVDHAVEREMYAALRETPVVSGVSVRAAALRSFEETVSESLRVSTITLIVFAGVIAVGVVYNGARIALSERGHELATLRVLGFNQREVATVLLGEQGVITVLALPLGVALGWGVCALVARASSSELYRLPLVVSGRTYVIACTVVLLSAALSGLGVRRRLVNLDLVAVLKARE